MYVINIQKYVIKNYLNTGRKRIIVEHFPLAVSCFPTSGPLLNHCLLPSIVQVVIHGCQLSSGNHSTVREMLPLETVFEYHAAIYLHTRSVTEISKF